MKYGWNEKVQSIREIPVDLEVFAKFKNVRCTFMPFSQKFVLNFFNEKNFLNLDHEELLEKIGLIKGFFNIDESRIICRNKKKKLIFYEDIWKMKDLKDMDNENGFVIQF